jgi:PilZ domain
MSEHRMLPRKRVLKAGTIRLLETEIACTVRNVSQTGAAVEAITPLFIPDRFILVIASDGLDRSCRVVWRKEKRLGVTFAEPSK